MTCIRIVKHVVHCQDCGKTWVDGDEECTCTCIGPELETWTVTEICADCSLPLDGHAATVHPWVGQGALRPVFQIPQTCSHADSAAASQIEPYPQEWLDAAAAELARQHHGGPADPDDIKLASEVLAAVLSTPVRPGFLWTDPRGRARLTGSLDTGGSFAGDDDDGHDDYYAQSTTACCPRQTIPDSCSCLEGCECVCLDCRCGEDDDDDFPEYELP